jgi:glycerol-3-phosphate dehydrogenase
MALGTFDRTRALAALDATAFDVLVVGGGITGAGVALDAASRGLRTALVERGDFASGTSSKSSKLVHGGLRYLQNGDVRLVYQALRERQRLLRNAPHLVALLPFLVPILGRDGLIDARVARALGSAMWMYDLTGGARIGKLHQRLSVDEVVAHMPTLPADRLAAGYLYFDATADDVALTLAVLRTAALDHGAVVVNHAAVRGFVRGVDGQVAGATVEVREPGGATRALTVRARQVVNATGVWADDVRGLDEGTHPGSIRPAKGVHLTLPWELVRNDVAVVLPVPGDRRTVFVVPWMPDGDGAYRFTYVGTTDTDHDGTLDDPRCTAEDVAYLLGALNAAMGAGRRVSEADVLGTWAGLRPLVRSAGTGRTADLSRRHRITTSRSGLVTVTGGKLTTYREMAEEAVDVVVSRLGRAAPRGARRSRTRRLALRGADGWRAVEARSPHLARRYGGEGRVVEALAEADPGLAEPLVPGLPYLRAEAIHAVRQEMALGLDDVLARRTRARIQDREATARAAGTVAQLIGPELGWTTERAEREAAAYREALAHESP